MSSTLRVLLFLAVVGFVRGGCNEKVAMRRNEVKYITSPNYPGNFTEYVDCYYDLYSTTSDPGLLVYVDVLDVTLSCDDDTVQLRVQDGFSRSPRNLGRICQGGQTTFRSPRQSLYLVFRSRTQHANRSRGFRLRVRTDPQYCHCYSQETAVLDVTSTPDLLTSPNYPYGTEANVNCRWLLKAPKDSRVNATILNADMKGSYDCHNFGLSVYDGKTTYDDTLLGSVCDNSLKSFHSSGPYLLLVFKAGPRVYRSGGGIQLNYFRIPSIKVEQQQVGETLFYIITALLILLILIVTIIAAFKLFILPRRRKKAERRRRIARARLTSITSSRHSNSSSSTGSSLSESLSQSELLGRQHHHHHHASCSRALSSSSVTSDSTASVWSGLSVARLLSLSTLKKFRQEHRHGAQGDNGGPSRGAGGAGGRRLGGAPAAPGTTCVVYNTEQNRRIIIRVPDYVESQSSCDLPPSYEEAVRQYVVTSEAVGHIAVAETLGRGMSGEAFRHGMVGEALGQDAEILTSEQDVLGEASGQGMLEQVSGEAFACHIVGEALGEALGQDMSRVASRQSMMREASDRCASAEAMGQGVLEEHGNVMELSVSGEAPGQGLVGYNLGQTVLGEALRQDMSPEPLGHGVLGEQAEAFGQSMSKQTSEQSVLEEALC